MSEWLRRAAGLAALSAALAPGVLSTSLDGWIVGRYQGAQLLPDSTAEAPSLTANGPRPRIEAVREGARADTLLAVHFRAERDAPLLTVGSRTTLAGPSGAITPIAARVLARRLFRAPRAPGSLSMPDSNWRFGWAYLVVVPHVTGRPSGRYRGWTLLEASDPAPRRRERTQP